VALFRRISEGEPTKEVEDPRSRVIRVAYAAAAFDGAAPPDSFRSQFPQVVFEPLQGEGFTVALRRADVAITTADGADAQAIERLCAELRHFERAGQVVVFLANPSVDIARRIVREGAGDVLTAPLSEHALAATLERIIAGLRRPAAGGGRSGHVAALLKAGGGVGATMIGAQLAAMVAAGREAPRVCLVDLDVQFGNAAVYLDISNSITMGEVLAAGGDPTEIGFTERLAPHSSGARVLAAPPAFLPLEAISLDLISSLISALRRDFDLVLLDMPTAWTAWTNNAIRLSDQILMITNLSVPHALLVRRQLDLLRTQGLDSAPITLICNRYGGDAPSSIPARSAASAIGRPFDVMIPEDRRLVNEAVNQGAALWTIRRESKVEKALRLVVNQINAARVASQTAGRS
jgi:pilus assembly protein CpaE